ncbi:hypothetical protein COO60DRAFT_442817 [Scenedesmus sp. NREL 46B-D3]|nr:hypothetical protein COO60DRAFT_442817 [Scenedesmus sp. NREL 46B-D3]
MGGGSSRTKRDSPDGRSLDAWSILSFAAAAYPDKLAIVDGHRTATYAQLHKHCISLAAGLHSLGITRGSRLAILHRNSCSCLCSWCLGNRGCVSKFHLLCTNSDDV